MDKYKKLTKQELSNMGFNVKENKPTQGQIDFVNKYYPPSAHTLTIVVNSEYNDQGYDNTFQYLIVSDVNGNELPPKKELAKECREHWDSLYYGEETNDEVEDITYNLKSTLPDLYIKL